MEQSAVDFLLYYLPNSIKGQFKEQIKQAKEMEKEQQNNLPIHIHEGISNTHVYIEDGVVHVEPNETFKSE
jgi:hypothetical protein